MMIVAISGADGSGKTRLSRNLVKSLTESGRKAKRVHLGDYFLFNFLVRLNRKIQGLIKPPFKNYSADDPFLSTNPKSIFKRSWLFVAMFDNAVTYLLLRTYVLFGYVVVCDRYFYDRLLALIYRGYGGSLLKKIYLYFTPTADLQIVLNQEPTISIVREVGDKHILDFYIRMRLHYENLKGLIDCYYIEVGNRGEKDVAEEVFLIINETDNSKPRRSNHH